METNIWKLSHAQYIPDECEIGPFEFHKRKKMWDILDFGAFWLHCWLQRLHSLQIFLFRQSFVRSELSRWSLSSFLCCRGRMCVAWGVHSEWHLIFSENLRHLIIWLYLIIWKSTKFDYLVLSDNLKIWSIWLFGFAWRIPMVWPTQPSPAQLRSVRIEEWILCTANIYTTYTHIYIHNIFPQSTIYCVLKRENLDINRYWGLKIDSYVYSGAARWNCEPVKCLDFVVVSQVVQKVPKLHKI